MVRPTAVDQNLRVGKHAGAVSTTSIGSLTSGLKFSPLKSLGVQGVEIVESNTLVANTSVTTENVCFSFFFNVGNGVISSGLRGSNLGFAVVVRLIACLLVGWLDPFEGVGTSYTSLGSW